MPRTPTTKELSCRACGARYSATGWRAQLLETCSPDCARKARTMARREKRPPPSLVARHCENCGITFTAPAVGRESSRRFCSVWCSRSFMGKQTTRRRLPIAGPLPDRCCLACGRQFTAADLVHKTRKYCNNACKGVAYEHPIVQLTCEGCERSFERKPNRVTRYCSIACWNEYFNKGKLAEKHPAFVGLNGSPNVVRRWFKQLYGDRCMVCGWSDAYCDIAHITPKRDGGAMRIENLIILCPNHHRAFDTGYIPAGDIQAARQRAAPLH